jgi:hypothetical protein
MKTVAMTRPWCSALLVLVALLSAGVLTAGPVDPPEDEGYFLSPKQKGQLIWWGRVQDDVGRWYDVWICPGYTVPTTYGWEHLKESGRQFHKYFEAKKYKDLSDNSMHCFEWAFRDCVGNFVLRGVPKAWDRYLKRAAERRQRRVFGSSLAYPWAVVEGASDTLFRGTGGLCGMLLGSAAGTTVVPAWYLLDSAAAGTAILVGQGLVLPVSGYAWNTLASPVLALAGGPRPAPSRADGFWVRIVDEQGRRRAKLDPEEVSAAVAWGVLMLTEVQPSLDQGESLAKETEQKISGMRQQATREQRRLQDEADRRAAQFRDSSGHPAAPLALIERYREQITEALRRDGTIPAQDIPKVMDLIRRYPPPLPPPAPQPAKTGPARRADATSP